MPRPVPRRESPDPPLPRREKGMVPVQPAVRLSASKLWDLQRAFFARQDPRAWGRGRVPSYVTSNAFASRAAGRVLGAFAEDAAAGRLGPVEAGARLNVLELGAGSGRFAFGVLREMEAREARTPAEATPQAPRLRYVVTDFHEAPVEALREVPRLRPFVARGLLDFAVVDVEAPGDVRLLESGEVLRPSERAAPVAAVANYVLDGVRADAYEVREGTLREAPVRLDAPDDVDPGDPASLASLQLTFEQGPPADAPYGDAELDARLHETAAGLPDGFVLFPVSALRFLRHLRQMGGGRALLLAADRGHVHADALHGLDAPHVARHGSVSLDVNFHALALHARATGGRAFLPAHHPTHLATVALLWGARHAEATRTATAYHEHLAEGGPEDLFVLKETVERQARRLTVERALAWLRTSAWDAEVYLACAPVLIDRAPASPPTVRSALAEAARRVRDAYYPVGGDRDVALALAELFQAVDAWDEADAMLDESLARHGRHADALHRKALGLSARGRTEDARRCLQEALAMDPKHEDARALLDALP